MIDIKNAAGDTVSTTNLQAVKSFVGAGGGATDLTFTGASSPYTLASSTGTDVTISAGTNVTLTRTGNDLEIASSGGSGAVATDAIWDAKGDLAVGTGANTAVKLTVGTDGKQIYADAGEATGLRWGPSIISPSQITSDQDDYAPTGWADAQVVRIDGDNSQRAITSFAATFSGDIKTISNVGSYPIYFPSEHPDGTAANRISGKKDNILPPGKLAQIMYDGTSSRWMWVTDIPDWDDGKLMLYRFRPSSSTVGDWGYIAFTSSGGSVSTSGPNATERPAAITLGTSSSSTAAVSLGSGKIVSALAYIGDAHCFSEATLTLSNLSNGTDTYEVNSGLFSSNISTSLNLTNSCGIRYTHGTNSGKFQGFSRDNASAESTVDLGITVAASTLYTLRTEINKTKNEVRFYVNGVYCGRVTGNMPSGTNVTTRTIIVKSLGSGSRSVYVTAQSFGAAYN